MKRKIFVSFLYYAIPSFPSFSSPSFPYHGKGGEGIRLSLFQSWCWEGWDGMVVCRYQVL